MLKEERYILIAWFFFIILIRLSLLLPHRYLDEIRLINTWVQVLLSLVSAVVAWKNKGSQRYVYLNFAIFFGFGILLFTNSFIGSFIFAGNLYASFYYHIYINMIGGGFIALLPIIYVLIDYTMKKIYTWKKYIYSILTTAAIVGCLSTPYIFKPNELYSHKDYFAFLQLQKIWVDLSKELNRSPLDQEIVNRINISVGDRNLMASQLKSDRLYLESGNSTTLFWKPLQRSRLYADFIALSILVVFVVIIYRFDRPYYPYLDKIMAVLIPVFVLEAFHRYGAIGSNSLENYRTLYTIGQYATVLMLLALIYIFHLNLRFVTSPIGSYYEQVVLKSPLKFTRWRDEIDTFILKTFSPNSHFLGRIATTSKTNQKE